MGNTVVIDTLNEVRRAELTALSQYMAHHYYFSDMGYPALAAESKTDSMDEMRHAELLAKRILDIGGEPDFTPLKPPHRRGTPMEMMEADMRLEEDAITRLNSGIRACSENGDSVSRNLLETILLNEETHMVGLKQHVDHLKNFGNDYLLKFVTAAQ